MSGERHDDVLDGFGGDGEGDERVASLLRVKDHARAFVDELDRTANACPLCGASTWPCPDPFCAAAKLLAEVRK
jgi:hypothetical protein